jgi:hypothetical protein
VDPLFHYTDTVGVVGILSSGMLFATDYRYLNDSSEGSSIKSHILPILQADVERIMPELIKKKILREDYYAELGTRVNELEAGSLYRALADSL